MRSRLEKKILGITGVIMVFSFVVAFTLNAVADIESLKKESMEKSLLIGEMIQRSIRTIMLTGNGDIASQWTEDLRGSGRLKELYVIKRDGMLAFRDLDTLNKVNYLLDKEIFSRDSLEGVRILEEDDDRLLKVISGKRELDYIYNGEGGRIFVQMKPVLNGIKCGKCHTQEHDVLGVLKIAITMREVDSGIRKIIMFAVGGCIGASVLVIVLLRLLIRILVTRPISEVASTIKEIIKSEKLDKTVTYRSQDEIGLMVENFNLMTGRLHELHKTLEDRVKERTRQLIQAEKLAALGQLATGLVHEVRNPLGGVKLALQLMEKDANDRLGEDIRAITKEIQRIENLLNELLRFAKPRPPFFTLTEINDVAERTLALVRKKAERANVEIVSDFSVPIRQVMADSDLLQQVFLNIILNAVHAMPDGGRLTVATRMGNNYVDASFSDSGAGIPADYIDKIFDPFFTTRGASGGTGLGLSLSYRIVHEHKGEILVDSVEGKGTTFTVRLPVAEEAGH